MIDKLSEKIDYMFRRGKNADERCFDFFLRSVTFFIILLAVLTYGGLVHAFSAADASFTDMIDVTLFINSSMAENYYSDNYESPYVQSSDMSHMFVNTLNPSPFSVDYIDLYAENLNNNQAVNSSGYAFKYLVIFGPKNGYTAPSDGINYFNIIEICSDSIPSLIDKNTGYSDRSISDYCIYCPDGAVVNNYSFGFSYNSFDGYRTQRFGLTTYNTIDSNGCYNLGSVGYGNTGYICYCNIPFYSFVYSNIYSSVDSSSRVYSDLSSFLGAVDEKQVYNLNPLLDSFIPPEPDPDPDSIENNTNHLYVDDIQVGLTANSVGEDLLSSELVIGLKVDDWVLNHIDDYSLYVGVTSDVKDTMSSSPNDPNASYSFILPLKVFMNRPYYVGVAELFRNMNISGYGSFLQYYNNLSNGGARVLAKNTFNGAIYYFLESMIQGLGEYYVTSSDSYEVVPYTIHNFTLTVSCALVDHISDEQSKPYVKEFDFLHGISSVKSAEILRNYNPWTGEETPQQSPLIPSGGSGVGYYAGGGSNTQVNVEVSGQKVPIGVKTRAEIETILNNYKDVNDNFMDQWEYLSDPNNNNNFIKFLNEETRQLPAVNYLISGACCIFGLAIILFILKVLLF